MKPAMYNKFWATHVTPDVVLTAVKEGRNLEHLLHAIKVIVNRPRNWIDCLHLARKKFEKYFNHKV